MGDPVAASTADGTRGLGDCAEDGDRIDAAPEANDTRTREKISIRTVASLIEAENPDLLT